MRPVLDAVTTPPFAVNTFVIGDADAGVALVVDPGGDADAVADLLARHCLRAAAIVATHAHIDHVAGARDVRARTGAPFVLHPDAVPMLASLGAQAVHFGLPPAEAPEVDGYLEWGQELWVGDLRLTVRSTPGHAPGHVTLVTDPIPLGGAPVRLALCGDVVFQGSIGRVDLPGGDYDTLMRSIERELLPLPDDTVLLSGHGPATSVGRERLHNPFIRDWLARAASRHAPGVPEPLNGARS